MGRLWREGASGRDVEDDGGGENYHHIYLAGCYNLVECLRPKSCCKTEEPQVLTSEFLSIAQHGFQEECLIKILHFVRYLVRSIFFSLGDATVPRTQVPFFAPTSGASSERGRLKSPNKLHAAQAKELPIKLTHTTFPLLSLAETAPPSCRHLLVSRKRSALSLIAHCRVESSFQIKLIRIWYSSQAHRASKVNPRRYSRIANHQVPFLTMAAVYFPKFFGADERTL